MPTSDLSPQEREYRLLDIFWWKVREGEDRLALLLAFSTLTIERPADWDRASIRATANQHRLTTNGCFGCGTHDRRLYWHHVIQIQNGGSNYVRNRVAICLRCHATIHPWLPESRPGEQLHGEWWSLSDVLNETRRREDATSDAIEVVVEEPVKVEP